MGELPEVDLLNEKDLYKLLGAWDPEAFAFANSRGVQGSPTGGAEEGVPPAVAAVPPRQAPQQLLGPVYYML